MKKLDFSTAKPGDSVWDMWLGPATVIDYNNSLTFPLIIKARDGGREGLRSRDGKCFDGDKAPITYWTKPEILGGDVPPKRTKKVKVDMWIAFYIYDGRIMASVYIDDPAHRKPASFETYLATKRATVELEIPEDV